MTLRRRWRREDRFLVRHKDAAILVVDKKAGLLTVPKDSGRGTDLMTLLRGFIGAKGRSQGIYLVHRLDRVVSGLLVFARRPDARERLIEQFARHAVDRRYVAAVSGTLPEDTGTFESWLRTDDPSLKVYSDAEGAPGTRRAVTHWRVIERFESGRATLVEVELETGIRNQIRVHFAEAGFPLLGERKYLPRKDARAAIGQGTERIFLHAAVLGFVHPITREKVRFESPLPSDLEQWRTKLRAQRERKKR